MSVEDNYKCKMTNKTSNLKTPPAKITARLAILVKNRLQKNTIEVFNNTFSATAETTTNNTPSSKQGDDTGVELNTKNMNYKKFNIKSKDLFEAKLLEGITINKINGKGQPQNRILSLIHSSTFNKLASRSLGEGVFKVMGRKVITGAKSLNLAKQHDHVSLINTHDKNFADWGLCYNRSRSNWVCLNLYEAVVWGYDPSSRLKKKCEYSPDCIVSLVASSKKNRLDMLCPTAQDAYLFAGAFSALLNLPITDLVTHGVTIEVLESSKSSSIKTPASFEVFEEFADFSQFAVNEESSKCSDNDEGKEEEIKNQQQKEKVPSHDDEVREDESKSLELTGAELPPPVPQKQESRTTVTEANNENSRIKKIANVSGTSSNPTKTEKFTDTSINNNNNRKPIAHKSDTTNSHLSTKLRKFDEAQDIEDAMSEVSSLTNHMDMDLVDELQGIILQLRGELHQARDEAARAVKVAEQAIQSAESCSSSDWNSTVTHKAAEAAALAQKKSAAALNRARIAEEKLRSESSRCKKYKQKYENLAIENRNLEGKLMIASCMSSASNNCDKSFDISFVDSEKSWRRKLLYNYLEVRGTMRVFCRVQNSGSTSNNDTTTILDVPTPETLKICRRKKETETYFQFDNVFSQYSNQEHIYEELKPFLLEVLDGFSINLLIYGPSSSDKESTFLGGDKLLCENQQIPSDSSGLFVRVVSDLLKLFSEQKEDNLLVNELFVSCLGVHNERLYDLLDDAKSSSEEDDKDEKQPQQQHARLEIKTNIDGETVVTNLSCHDIKSIKQVSELSEIINNNNNNRINIAGDDDQYNRTAHTILTLNVKRTNIQTGEGTLGKLKFTKLAACDYPSNDQLQSKTNINDNHNKYLYKSIDTFHNVIEAKAQYESSKMPPYRSSTVTHLLRDDLEGGDAKVLLMLHCFNELHDNEDESYNNVLKMFEFGAIARQMQVVKSVKKFI